MAKYSGKAGRWGLAAALLVTVAQYLFLHRCLGAGLVSSYPGIEYDGFDWVTQGLYVRELLDGHVGFPMLFLRSPVFVLVTALDALCGSTGRVVLATLCLAHGISLLALLSIWRRLGVSGRIQAALFAMAVLSPYAYFRGYILADPVAIAGMLVSARCMLVWFQEEKEGAFTAAAATGLVAGLTQLYGLLPFLAGAALSWIEQRRAKRPSWPHMGLTAGVLVLGGLILAGWNAAIPHEDVPTQFGLLRPSLAMADFYANVWTWYDAFLLPVALAGLLLLWHRPFRAPSPAVRFLLATTALFVALLFFYQSEEARFSWYYFPLLLCLAAAVLARLENLGRGTIAGLAVTTSLVVLVGQSLLVSPPDYWQPRIADARLNPAQTWLAVFVRARPVDRLDLAARCGAPGVWCEASGLPADLEDDERQILADYRRLRLGHTAGREAEVATTPRADAADTPEAPDNANKEKWTEDWQ